MTADEIRTLRTRLGLTQEQLAANLGVSWATVQRWEKGKTKPSPLAEARLRELFERIERERKEQPMNRRTSDRLASQIIHDDPQCQITGTRKYGDVYELDVVDTRTGTAFVVRSPEDWEERKERTMSEHYSIDPTKLTAITASVQASRPMTEAQVREYCLGDYHEAWARISDATDGEYLSGTIETVPDDRTFIVRAVPSGRRWECRHLDGEVVEAEVVG